MIPSQECFESGNFVAREIDDRLVIEFEFTIGKRTVQLASPLTSSLVLQVEFRGKEPKCIPPFRLCVIKRQIRVLEYRIDGVSVFRGNGDSDAREGGNAMVAELCGLRESGNDLASKSRTFFTAVLHRHDDREFIPAQAGNKVAVPQSVSKAVGHAAQERIAGRMAEGVVDLFEIVEIEQHDCEPAAPIRSTQ